MDALKKAWNSKMGRAQFAILFLSVAVLALAIVIYLDKKAPTWLVIAIWLTSTTVKIMLIKQRLNDIGRPGKNIIYLFVPIVNFVFILYLMFKRGNRNIEELLASQEDKISKADQSK